MKAYLNTYRALSHGITSTLVKCGGGKFFVTTIQDKQGLCKKCHTAYNAHTAVFMHKLHHRPTVE